MTEMQGVKLAELYLLLKLELRSLLLSALMGTIFVGFFSVVGYHWGTFWLTSAKAFAFLIR